jgi:endonuclease-8
MPEGPEVRTQADRLARALVGRPLTDVWFEPPRLKPWEAPLRSAGIAAVHARGKAFLVRFADGHTLYVHHQLYGRWSIARAGTHATSTRTLRAALRTDSVSALLWSATDVDVLDDAGLAAHNYLRRLGPDVLDATTTADLVLARLADRRFARRSLAALYLDQGFLAGVGNYLRTEVLWYARVDPASRPTDLSADAQERLADSTVRICRRAYTTGGVTSDPERVAAGRAAGLPRRAWRHCAFGRQGKPCPRCGAGIARVELAGRRIYVCACQRAVPG